MNAGWEKHISYDSIEIEPMREEYVQPSIELWTTQFKNVKNTVQDIPEKWIIDVTATRLFLEEHVKTGKGIVAKTDGDVIGYMVYDRLPFHGADTAFCPVMGHASVESGRARIYQKMYKNISDLWVKDAVLDHIITFFSLDVQLKQVLINLGFGLYVVDAFRSADPVDSNGGASILKASLSDVEAVNDRLTGDRMSISRASIINFLNGMVDDDFLSYTEITGKGGHRRIYSAALTKEEFWAKITKEVDSKLTEASGLPNLFIMEKGRR